MKKALALLEQTNLIAGEVFAKIVLYTLLCTRHPERGTFLLMELIRIGDKLLSRTKIERLIDQILELRVQGVSQQEVARRLNIDRTFVSRLERSGEIRKGSRIAVIGFPVENKNELNEALTEEGVEFILLMTDAERWHFVQEKSGLELLNEIMEIIARVRVYDVVIIIGSNYRIKISEALLNKEVVGVEIGQSPIAGDVYVNPGELTALVRSLASNGPRNNDSVVSKGGLKV
ncbi:MAG: transcriptional regulator [Bacillota bacterium]